MNSKTLLLTVPVPSTEFATEAYLVTKQNPISLCFEYRTGHSVRRGCFSFDHPATYRYTAERCCIPWQIDDSYDSLVEVVDSEWVNEVRARMHSVNREAFPMHHYMIYFDSVGCFEFIAAGWHYTEDVV